ncbi:MAG: VanW family protein [Oscillospiraceae bacterium]
MTKTVKGGARLQKSDAGVHRKTGKIVLISLLILLALLAALYGALCALAATSETIFPGTTLLGNDVGGMTQQEAEEYLAPLLPEAYRENGISICLDGEEVWFASLTDLGFSPSAARCAELAYAAGRGGNVLQGGYAYARSLLLGREVTPPLNLSESSVRQAVTTIVRQVDREPQDLSCRLSEEDTAHVFFTQAREGVVVDEAALLEDMSVLLEQGSLKSVECRYTALPYDEAVTVQSLAEELLGERKNASYDTATGDILEATVGVTFDVAQAEALLSTARPGQEVAVPGTVEFPAVYAEELEQVLFRDLLGSYSTDLTGTAARISNVTLAARACNGAVLNSGDIFSFNGRVGKRTEERGYKPAPAYVAGETVDTIGGGICQVSSTLYYACLLANLEITSRTAHRYVSSYIPYGLDATVSWGTLDYKFCNNTDYPIKVVTSVSNGKITVQLYGTKTDDSYVVMTSEQLGTTDWETQYVETDELPAGTQEVKQTPYTGRKIQTYRNVYAGDGTLLSSTPEAFSDYKSRDKIVLVGTGASQSQEPSDPGTEDPGSGGGTGTDGGTETGGGTGAGGDEPYTGDPDIDGDRFDDAYASGDWWF